MQSSKCQLNHQPEQQRRRDGNSWIAHQSLQKLFKHSRKIPGGWVWWEVLACILAGHLPCCQKNAKQDCSQLSGGAEGVVVGRWKHKNGRDRILGDLEGWIMTKLIHRAGPTPKWVKRSCPQQTHNLTILSLGSGIHNVLSSLVDFLSFYALLIYALLF